MHASMRARRAGQVLLAPIAILIPVVLVLAACQPLLVQPRLPSQVTISGHGWGHGRGMGQYGAYGYAVDHGWSGSQILDHFYGGTRAARRSLKGVQRVVLRAQAGKDVIVDQERGHLKTSADGWTLVRRALRIQRVNSRQFKVYSGRGCGGPWTAWPGLITTGEISLRPTVKNSNNPAEMLKLCERGGARYLRDYVSAVLANGTIQTVNRIDTESYLRSVVPREVPASWAYGGGGRGGRALNAQAVAARSYALAGDRRWGSWATTCADTACQVYAGFGFRWADGRLTRFEHPATDWAIGTTERTVRMWSSGRIARTEFSSSTGGWTAGGDFRAVRDDGDNTRANPNHTWSVRLSAGSVESAFDRRQGRDVGRYEGMTVLSRNGLGAGGGRVRSVVVRFTGTDVTVTGDQLRVTLGLKSNWFSVR